MVTTPSLQQQLANASAAQGGTESVNVPNTGTNLTQQQQIANIAANSPNSPLSVPDRNISVIDPNSATLMSTPALASSSSSSLQSISSSQSNQLDSTPIPDPSSDGIPAAASGPVPIVPASDVFVMHDVLPDGAASPVNAASLQSTSANNPFATIQPAAATLNPLNQPNTGKDQYDRVKLRFKPGHPLANYPAGSVLNPLALTSGLVWLYKPAVSVQMNVDYETLGLTHSIQELHAFSSNKAASISVSGQFVSQNVDEAMYSLAAIHFMRTVCKMSFGTELAGTTSIPLGSPPPVLLLSGYGSLMMNDMPVIVSNFSLDLPADVDYISVPFNAGSGTKIPVSFNLTATLIVQQSPAVMRQFNLSSYSATGMKGWWSFAPLILTLPHIFSFISSII